ncbi:MAG: universal stress protein [Candidatus Competibacterales bacterium]|nr:universal stress protein [Candidatus Competibacterales bacterium]
MFSTILVATDDSEHARKAVDLAADLAEKYQARLVLMHVVNPKQVSPDLRHMAEVEHLVQERSPLHEGARPEVPTDWNLRLASLRDNVDTNLKILNAVGQRLLDDIRQRIGSKVAQVDTRLEEGDAVDCILDCAKAEQADLIVLGSRGLSELKGLMMGSVSHKVSQLAECTCVTVK